MESSRQAATAAAADRQQTDSRPEAAPALGAAVALADAYTPRHPNNDIQIVLILLLP